jgi:pyruvate formate lyase activating enzyme
METVREAVLYQTEDGVVQCLLCERLCRIPQGKRGFCGARRNSEGVLYTLTYGHISALESRPIEIKPFFHYHPGSSAMTFSTWGCNLPCPWCQNWHLSRRRADPRRAAYLSPGELVEKALREGDRGVCASFQEPTILFEYLLDVFRLARERGLYSCAVSNGYMTERALEMLREAGMDAINIDIKGDEEVYRKYLGGLRAEVVWRNAEKARELGIHVEMVNLIVTGVNDSREQIKAIVEEHLRRLGSMVPLHFTRYFPAYRFTAPPPQVSLLEDAYNLARDMGVCYPYVGNIPGHRYENTYCHRCGLLLIERDAYSIKSYRVTRDKRCPGCGAEIPLVGDPPIVS